MHERSYRYFRIFEYNEISSVMNLLNEVFQNLDLCCFSNYKSFIDIFNDITRPHIYMFISISLVIDTSIARTRFSSFLERVFHFCREKISYRQDEKRIKNEEFNMQPVYFSGISSTSSPTFTTHKVSDFLSGHSYLQNHEGPDRLFSLIVIGAFSLSRSVFLQIFF